MIETLPGRRFPLFEPMALASRPLHPMMAEDIDVLLKDASPVRRNVIGRLNHVYRSEFDGTPIVLADIVCDRQDPGTVTTVFATGLTLKRVEHLFQNDQQIAVKVRYRADDDSLLAIDALDDGAGIEMPLRPLTDVEFAAQRETRLTVDQLLAIDICYYRPEIEQHGWYGVERLPVDVRRLRIGAEDGDPLLAVDATWTLATFVEVVKLAHDYAKHERLGQATSLALTLEGLRRRGLVSATPQTPESIKAILRAQGEVPDPDGLWPFEREVDREHWCTSLAFEDATGTLYVTPSYEG